MHRSDDDDVTCRNWHTKLFRLYQRPPWHGVHILNPFPKKTKEYKLKKEKKLSCQPERLRNLGEKVGKNYGAGNRINMNLITLFVFSISSPFLSLNQPAVVWS